MDKAKEDAHLIYCKKICSARYSGRDVENFRSMNEPKY